MSTRVLGSGPATLRLPIVLSDAERAKTAAKMQQIVQDARAARLGLYAQYGGYDRASFERAIREKQNEIRANVNDIVARGSEALQVLEELLESEAAAAHLEELAAT